VVKNQLRSWHTIHLDQVNDQIEEIKLVENVEFDDQGRRFGEPAIFNVLVGQLFKIVRRNYALDPEQLDEFEHYLGTDLFNLCLCELSVLVSDLNRAFVNHKFEGVPSDTDHNHGDLVAGAASFQQVDREIEDVVFFGVVKLLGEYELLHVFDFRVDHSAFFVQDQFGRLATGGFESHANQNGANQFPALEHGWIVICKISCVVLLSANPIFDEASRFAERAECVELLDEALVRLRARLGILLVLG